MASWKILNLKSGKIAVFTPYNASIVAECKRRMGKWITVTGMGDAWAMDKSHRAAMEALCTELFPSRDALIERVITWSSNSSLSSPTIDGYRLVWFGRDGYSFAQSKAGEPFGIVEVLEDELGTAGSKNHPRLWGKVTLRVRCRPQAEAAGDDWSVEVA